MQWKTRFNLMKLTQHKHILLLGNFNGMHYEYKFSKDLLDKKVVFTTDEVKALGTSVIFTWDSFKQFGHIFYDHPTRCLKSLNPTDSDICFQILSPSKLKYYVIFNFNEQDEKNKRRIQICARFMTLFPQHGKENYCNFNISNQLKMISWRNTSQICKNMNGSLPNFTFKNELDELIALLKLSDDIPPVHAMFIGLNFYQNQVLFCHFFI